VKTTPDYGKNDRRSFRYHRKNVLECDWSKTKMTLRDVNFSQWESRRPDRRWISYLVGIPDELTKLGRSEPEKQSSSDYPKRSSKLSRGPTKLNLLNQLWAYQA